MKKLFEGLRILFIEWETKNCQKRKYDDVMNEQKKLLQIKHYLCEKKKLMIFLYSLTPILFLFQFNSKFELNIFFFLKSSRISFWRDGRAV